MVAKAVKVEYTHRRARRTLETREATMTLYASVTLFACLTLVTTGALGSLKERKTQAVRCKFTSSVEWNTVHIWASVQRT